MMEIRLLQLGKKPEPIYCEGKFSNFSDFPVMHGKKIVL